MEKYTILGAFLVFGLAMNVNLSLGIFGSTARTFAPFLMFNGMFVYFAFGIGITLVTCFVVIRRFLFACYHCGDYHDMCVLNGHPTRPEIIHHSNSSRRVRVHNMLNHLPIIPTVRSKPRLVSNGDIKGLLWPVGRMSITRAPCGILNAIDIAEIEKKNPGVAELNHEYLRTQRVPITVTYPFSVDIPYLEFQGCLINFANGLCLDGRYSTLTRNVLHHLIANKVSINGEPRDYDYFAQFSTFNLLNKFETDVVETREFTNSSAPSTSSVGSTISSYDSEIWQPYIDSSSSSSTSSRATDRSINWSKGCRPSNNRGKASRSSDSSSNSLVSPIPSRRGSPSRFGAAQSLALGTVMIGCLGTGLTYFSQIGGHTQFDQYCPGIRYNFDYIPAVAYTPCGQFLSASINSNQFFFPGCPANPMYTAKLTQKLVTCLPDYTNQELAPIEDCTSGLFRVAHDSFVKFSLEPSTLNLANLAKSFDAYFLDCLPRKPTLEQFSETISDAFSGPVVPVDEFDELFKDAGLPIPDKVEFFNNPQVFVNDKKNSGTLALTLNLRKFRSDANVNSNSLGDPLGTITIPAPKFDIDLHDKFNAKQILLGGPFFAASNFPTDCSELNVTCEFLDSSYSPPTEKSIEGDARAFSTYANRRNPLVRYTILFMPTNATNVLALAESLRNSYSFGSIIASSSRVVSAAASSVGSAVASSSDVVVAAASSLGNAVASSDVIVAAASSIGGAVVDSSEIVIAAASSLGSAVASSSEVVVAAASSFGGVVADSSDVVVAAASSLGDAAISSSDLFVLAASSLGDSAISSSDVIVAAVSSFRDAAVSSSGAAVAAASSLGDAAASSLGDAVASSSDVISSTASSLKTVVSGTANFSVAAASSVVGTFVSVAEVVYPASPSCGHTLVPFTFVPIDGCCIDNCIIFESVDVCQSLATAILSNAPHTVRMSSLDISSFSVNDMLSAKCGFMYRSFASIENIKTNVIPAQDSTIDVLKDYSIYMYEFVGSVIPEFVDFFYKNIVGYSQCLSGSCIIRYTIPRSDRYLASYLPDEISVIDSSIDFSHTDIAAYMENVKNTNVDSCLLASNRLSFSPLACAIPVVCFVGAPETLTPYALDKCSWYDIASVAIPVFDALCDAPQFASIRGQCLASRFGSFPCGPVDNPTSVCSFTDFSPIYDLRTAYIDGTVVTSSLPLRHTFSNSPIVFSLSFRTGLTITLPHIPSDVFVVDGVAGALDNSVWGVHISSFGSILKICREIVSTLGYSIILNFRFLGLILCAYLLTSFYSRFHKVSSWAIYAIGIACFVIIANFYRFTYITSLTYQIFLFVVGCCAPPPGKDSARIAYIAYYTHGAIWVAFCVLDSIYLFIACASALTYYFFFYGWWTYGGAWRRPRQISSFDIAAWRQYYSIDARGDPRLAAEFYNRCANAKAAGQTDAALRYRFIGGLAQHAGSEFVWNPSTALMAVRPEAHVRDVEELSPLDLSSSICHINVGSAYCCGTFVMYNNIKCVAVVRHVFVSRATEKSYAQAYLNPKFNLSYNDSNYEIKTSALNDRSATVWFFPVNVDAKYLPLGSNSGNFSMYVIAGRKTGVTLSGVAGNGCHNVNTAAGDCGSGLVGSDGCVFGFHMAFVHTGNRKKVNCYVDHEGASFAGPIDVDGASIITARQIVDAEGIWRNYRKNVGGYAFRMSYLRGPADGDFTAWRSDVFYNSLSFFERYWFDSFASTAVQTFDIDSLKPVFEYKPSFFARIIDFFIALACAVLAFPSFFLQFSLSSLFLIIAGVSSPLAIGGSFARIVRSKFCNTPRLKIILCSIVASYMFYTSGRVEASCYSAMLVAHICLSYFPSNYYIKFATNSGAFDYMFFLLSSHIHTIYNNRLDFHYFHIDIPEFTPKLSTPCILLTIIALVEILYCLPRFFARKFFLESYSNSKLFDFTSAVKAIDRLTDNVGVQKLLLDIGDSSIHSASAAANFCHELLNAVNAAVGSDISLLDRASLATAFTYADDATLDRLLEACIRVESDLDPVTANSLVDGILYFNGDSVDLNELSSRKRLGDFYNAFLKLFKNDVVLGSSFCDTVLSALDSMHSDGSIRPPVYRLLKGQLSNVLPRLKKEVRKLYGNTTTSDASAILAARNAERQEDIRKRAVAVLYRLVNSIKNDPELNELTATFRLADQLAHHTRCVSIVGAQPFRTEVVNGTTYVISTSANTAAPISPNARILKVDEKIDPEEMVAALGVDCHHTVTFESSARVCFTPCGAVIACSVDDCYSNCSGLLKKAFAAHLQFCSICPSNSFKHPNCDIVSDKASYVSSVLSCSSCDACKFCFGAPRERGNRVCVGNGYHGKECVEDGCIGNCEFDHPVLEFDDLQNNTTQNDDAEAWAIGIREMIKSKQLAGDRLYGLIDTESSDTTKVICVTRHGQVGAYISVDPIDLKAGFIEYENHENFWPLRTYVNRNFALNHPLDNISIESVMKTDFSSDLLKHLAGFKQHEFAMTCKCVPCTAQRALNSRPANPE
jgi:hypothetical protein